MKKILSNPNAILQWCLWFTITFVLLYDFYLIQIPERIPGGYKFGVLFYKICFAFITSYIFFFLNVVLKKRVDKKNISPYFAKKTHFVIQRVKNLFAEISNKSGVRFEGPFPSKEELSKACKEIDPNSDAPILGLDLKYLTWIQYLQHHKIETSAAIQNLYAYMQHLESKQIKLLHDIEESVFFKRIDTEASVPLRNKDLTAWVETLLKYSSLVNDLEQYYDEKLKPFSPGFEQDQYPSLLSTLLKRFKKP